MKALFVLVLVSVLASCTHSPKTSEMKASVKTHKTIKFVAVETEERPLKDFDPKDIDPDQDPQFHLQVHSAYYSESTGQIWVGGALYFNNMIYRSILLSTDGHGYWTEERPTSSGLAFVFLAPINEGSQQVGLVGVESLYTEGSALETFSVLQRSGSNAPPAWVQTSVKRHGKGGDVFKKAIGCCTEMIQSLEIKGDKNWNMTVAGHEKVADFVSKDGGAHWSVKGSAKPHDLANEKQFRTWLTTPNDHLDSPEVKTITLDFSQRPVHYILPRYWKTKVIKNKIAVKPLP